MARQSRIVFPDIPHHVTQRGNRKQDVFFSEEDRSFYLKWLGFFAKRYHVSILAFCLMSNHVHLVLVPSTADGLHRMLKALHSKYARRINERMDWSGHLWQSRFYSNPLDEQYLSAAVKYVELNPVRAGLVEKVETYRWASARYRIHYNLDSIIDFSHYWNSFLPDSQQWSEYLGIDNCTEMERVLRRNSSRNLPCGSSDFIERLQLLSGYNFEPAKIGRPRKQEKK